MASADDLLKLNQQLCFPIYAASNLLVRAYRPLLEPLGLTYSQYLVMLVLWERGSVGAGDLARCLYLDSGTLTPLLKRMEHGGFIRRRRDINDERRVIIDLTDHGIQLRKAAMEVPLELARQFEASALDGDALRDTVSAVVKTLAERIHIR
jgi:DNA-binding MarR family transcriptional regulator